VYEPRPGSVLELLSEARRRSDRTFLVQGSRRLTSGQFTASVESAAARLAGLGVAAGDRVMILAYNCPEFVLCTWALWRLGAIPVMGNRWWSTAEIVHATELTCPALLATDLPDPSVVAVPALALSDLAAAWNRGSADGGGSLPSASPTEDDPAVILFTSGSTAVPKAVVLSHRSVVANQHNLLLRSRRLPPMIDPREPQHVTLVCTPLFHIGGISTLITQLITGGRLVLHEGRFDARQVLKLIEAERVQNWGGVPTMASRVLEHPDFGSFDLSSLRSFPLGGAPLPPALLDRMRDKLPQLRRRGLANTWGMTESGGFLTVAGNRELHERPGTVGRPYPAVELRIADRADGGVGEILVRSPTVMIGYFGIDDDTVDVDGWLHTGDLGRLDEDGYLFLNGRSKDIVIRGGENIACAHVEQALAEHPDVVEAAVFGVPHDDLGEELAAVVVVRAAGALGEGDLRDHLRSRLAYFEIPSVWSVRSAPLPTLAGEKIDTRTLRQELTSGGLRIVTARLLGNEVAARARCRSGTLDDRGRGHPAAGAHRDEPGGQVAPFELVEHGLDEHGSGGADRMAKGDGAAIDVDPVFVDLQVADDLHRDGRERLIDLP
jgi:acyl-CoA synthetase (AMP-forming)/AMP-acid ligase II